MIETRHEEGIAHAGGQYSKIQPGRDGRNENEAPNCPATLGPGHEAAKPLQTQNRKAVLALCRLISQKATKHSRVISPSEVSNVRHRVPEKPHATA